MLPLLLLSCRPPEPDSATPDTAVAVEGEFESAETCAECHPRQYTEWRESMHAYAARSPVFDAMASRHFEESGGEIGTFCTGCHALVGESEGEPGNSSFAERSTLSAEGVTCDVCHTAVGHGTEMANADLIHEPGPVKRGPYEGDDWDVHTGAKDAFVTSSELCATCHQITSPLNGMILEETYTEYIDSPADRSGMRCQDCHMGPDPGMPAERPFGPSAIVDGESYGDREQADHRFIGPDYSLVDDFPYPDDLEASALAQVEHLALVDKMVKNAVHFSGVEVSYSEEKGTIELSLVVECSTAGHMLPTGLTSERQLWLLIEVRDPSGKLVFTSGDLDSYGDLRDSHSQDVLDGVVPLDEHLINFQSRNRIKGSDKDAILPLDADYIESRGLQPLEIREVTYSIPLAGSGIHTVHAELQFRNLPPYLLRYLELEELVERLHIFSAGFVNAQVAL